MSPALRQRGPLLALGALALVAGVWAGLSRLGAAPVGPAAPVHHGPLMVSGFLGTVISLERAVAVRARWALLGPLLCALGTMMLLLSRPSAAAALLTAGSAVVVAVQASLLRHRELHLSVLMVAAVSWLVGNALWAGGRAVFEAVPFWLVFLVGTIAAERLELSRLLPRSPTATRLFLLVLALLLGGAALGLVWRDLGMRVLGAGALGLAAWLFRFDVARRTVRQRGSVGYIAVALLLGYLWLAVGGALALALGNPLAGPRYDALLHALLVGFVFSMVFGHALIVVPALLEVRIEFRPRFYAHLLLLHVSVALRLLGDAGGWSGPRHAGAWLNAAAIALFIVSTALAALGNRTAVRSAACRAGSTTDSGLSSHGGSRC